MNILVIAPHPDDEAIGCGGSVCLQIQRGHRVAVAFLSSGELGLKHLPASEAQSRREAEALAASAVLGTAASDFLRLPDWGCGDAVERGAAALTPILDRERPELLLLPHPGEDHPDHRAALPMVSRALSIIRGPIPELRGYEVWTPMTRFDDVEDITRVMDRKLAALSCHRSQLTEFRYDRAITGLNQFRGALAARCDYAEVTIGLEPGT